MENLLPQNVGSIINYFINYHDDLDETMTMWTMTNLIMMRFVRSERLVSDDGLDEDCEVYHADE